MQLLDNTNNKFRQHKSVRSVITPAQNVHKTRSHADHGYDTAILYMAPSTVGGIGDACPFSTKACRKACIFYTGRGQMNAVQQARIRRWHRFMNERDDFLAELYKRLKSLQHKADRNGNIAAMRLNGTTDLLWEGIKYEGKNMMEHFPRTLFYDYTKIPNRMYKKLPDNYTLVFSRSETNHDTCMEILKNTRHKISVVVPPGRKPKTWLGHRCADADKHDLLFLYKGSRILLLSAKGKMKKDTSGYVWRNK